MCKVFIDPADPKPARRLNLARLIMIYVRNFEFSCPNEALHYFYLLRNHKDSEGRSLFKICVTDLALETKEYEKLLGKMLRNGVRTKGLIDQFVDSNISADSVAELVGTTLVRKGLHEEAIDIFDIANVSPKTLFCVKMLNVIIAESGRDSKTSLFVAVTSGANAK